MIVLFEITVRWETFKANMALKGS
jgi:hypothetical protein